MVTSREGLGARPIGRAPFPSQVAYRLHASLGLPFLGHLVGLSVDVETADRVFDFAASTGIGYTVVIAEEASLDWMFPGGELFVPVTVLLDDRARLVEVVGSWNRATQERVEELANR